MTLFRWDVPGYAVAFSTRLGGVSEGRFSSLNLGRRSGDDVDNVDENRRLLCDSVGTDVVEQPRRSPERTRRSCGARTQKGEGSAGRRALDGRAGRAAARPHGRLPADRARPSGPQRPRGVARGVAGFLAGIVEAGAAALGGGGLDAALGPAIGPCCYEVGPEVAARFERESRSGRNLDLWSAAERRLQEAGCRSVERLDLCTLQPRPLFSYRRDGKPYGGQGVLAYVA